MRGISAIPAHISLMPVSAIGTQSVKSDSRSAGEHLKTSTEEFQSFQPVGYLMGAPEMSPWK